jgi:two-component system, sensor histidine kinase and response regulator
MNPRKTVFLVVDDIQAMRNITVSLLRETVTGNILVAENGQEALQILEKQSVDIVLSDWNMPVMSGLAMLKTMRQNPRLANIPVVMITGEADRARVGEAIAAGVSDLLVKPYSSGQLLERIDRAMSRGHAALGKPVAHTVTTPTPSATQQPIVLVVDDTAANLQLSYELLKDEFQVRTALNGQKALDICHSDTPPDLVLLDVMMPGMDGFEVARRLREHPNSETIPVIFVTAKTDQQSRLEGMELGAVDFVAKPIDPEILLPRVRNFMRYVALQKQLQATCDTMLEAARLREDVERMTRHDLKGPLAGIVSLAQALAASETLREEEMQQANLIADSALQVLDMINLSSELFKIETGRFELQAQPVSLGKLLERIVQTAAATYAGKGIDLSLEWKDGGGECMVLGDPALCYSIFHNLIKNACEAAPPDSPVRVALSCGESAQIVVSNQGMAPASERERFFEKPTASGEEDGTGLGAYSARLLTEAQGGQIAVDVSGRENRTWVTVNLPQAKMPD